MLKRVFLLAFGLLLPQLVRSEEGLSVYNEPYEWKPMMPRCDHLTMIYDNLEYHHDKIKSQYPNSFTTSHDAYLSLFAWCREYAVKRNQPVSKEWDKWWNATEGVTDFDRFYMDGLEELVTDGDPGVKGDIDQVFDLVTLTAQVNAQPINVFIWKVILSLYQERPADLKLKNFIDSNYADLNINIPDDVITDYWLEKVITEVILPAELKRNKEQSVYLELPSRYLCDACARAVYGLIDVLLHKVIYMAHRISENNIKFRDVSVASSAGYTYFIQSLEPHFGKIQS
ncbi:hypothetical protein BZA77DRAFT_294215 [Pyronema omphalodes]|nr:hypothetical protein BZA77DRAFT_294215 [Pyronema omphalodes]